MKTIYIFFYIIIISVIPEHGKSQIQEIINSSGGSSKNKGYIIDWNIGESALVNEMNSVDGNYILTNGFIQPFSDVSIPLTKIELSPADIRIFPNPTQDILQVNSFQNTKGIISLQLSNALGHIVYARQILVHGSGFVEKINMKGFIKGIYTLYLKRLNARTGRYDPEYGSYKIIKL